MKTERTGMKTMRAMVLGLLVTTMLPAWAADPNPPTLNSTQGAWPIRRQWTPEEARHFGKWVQHIYRMKTTGTVEQRTAKIERVLTDPEMNLLLDPVFAGQGTNPQIPQNVMRMMHSVLDCAKFTQVMPAYYAYRRSLPWMISYVASSGGDIRMAEYTIPTSTLSSFNSGSLNVFFRDMIRGFNSGNYRVPPYSKNWNLSDSVPVAIDPQYLIPGVVNYTDGHCLLLADVDQYGELHFLNAGTADTRDIYTYNGLNTVVGIEPRKDGPPAEAWNKCYQGLRLYRFPIAETDGSGKVTRVRRRTDEEMRAFGFSLEQYEKMREMVTSHRIMERDIELRSFHELIRLRLRSAEKVLPLQFMEEYADDLVEMWVFRDSFVQNAWKDVKANGPISYPEKRANENIFQANGRWETWSSPSSDVDRRNKYFYLADWMDDCIDWYDRMPQYVDLTGFEKYNIRTKADLARAIIAEKNRIFDQKYFHYTNSKGEKVPMTLAEAERRLYDFSFDPNHPPELRWGAKPGTPEFGDAKGYPTPVPDGTRVPMEDAYRLQAYYRCVGLREQEPSYLRGMFTEGYPVRSKFDEQLAKWIIWDTEAGKSTQLTQAEPAPVAAPQPVVEVREPSAAARDRAERRSTRRGPGPSFSRTR